MRLFRDEVINHRRGRLHGTVNLAVPVSWILVTGLFVAIVASGILWLSLAEYESGETVSGVISPEEGLARIVPNRAGVFKSVSVKEGQLVGIGATLATIQSGQGLAQGGESLAAILKSLAGQEEGLNRREFEITSALRAEKNRLMAQIAGTKSSLASLHQQVSGQEGLIRSAREELEIAKGVAERGFLSRRDLQQREETYLIRRQQRSQLTREISNHLAEIRQALASITEAEADARNQIAMLSGQRSVLALQRTNAEMSDAYRLTAPVSGQVTALTARPGQSTDPQHTAMIIIPSNPTLIAELYVPTRAIGFLRTGQEVRLAVDAFPFQRFGTIPATIVSVSAAPTVVESPNVSTPVYLVIARPKRLDFSNFTEDAELVAGMNLTARIVTEKQSFIEWLFDPLLAVRDR